MMISALALLAALAGADTTAPPQGVDYRIEARLDEATDVLHARARLRYTNRSGATLDTLWFHQHLNAFRPHSAWARRELQFGIRRFQDLDPDQHAFERFTRVRVASRAASPVYPGAPDSTVVAIPLPAPLLPGETAVVELDWDARLATVPRRQGRQGRHFDFAQWYPRIAVFEEGRWRTQPLLPQGEFYGEFGSFDVTLDVAADQVLGATGVPAEGDPGWAGAAAPGTGPILYQRDAYPASAAEPLGLLQAEAGAGRKRVRWRARDVHHFAWSADPAFRYEQGTVPRAGAAGEAIPIHVLYQPGDTSWAGGVVIDRAAPVLRWLQQTFGPYPWPQLTILKRLDRSGTEFPMLVMNNTASEGLIAHEVIHQYLHGILANNEFLAGWLDEGFTDFVESVYFESQGRADVWEPTIASVLERERAGRTQPIATPSADFVDFATYGAMTYSKPSLVFRMLRELVGAETMSRVLREYYRRHALSHVSEADLRRVAEQVSGQELDWFFDQWLHTTATLDYGIGDARTRRLPDGRWSTRVRVIRMGEAWMPVTLQVGDERRTLASRERVQEVEVVTAGRPREAVLDPRGVLLDLDPGNNRRGL